MARVSRRKEVADLLCCRDQQRACRMAQASTEKLEHTRPAEKKSIASVLQKEHLACTPEPPLPKGKETEHQIVRRALSVREVKGTAAEEREEYSSAEEQ